MESELGWHWGLCSSPKVKLVILEIPKLHMPQSQEALYRCHLSPSGPPNNNRDINITIN